MVWVRILAFSMAVLCASAAFSQGSGCLQRTVPVNILDDKRLPVTDISTPDLRAEVHGGPIQIVSVANDTRARRILILLDASASMQGASGELWKASLLTAEGLAELNPPNTSLALYIFGEKANERIGFSEGNSRLLNRLRQIENDPTYLKTHVYGMTPLRDAIAQGVRLFGSAKTQNAIFAITDGGDNVSRVKEGELVRTLLAQEVRLYICLMGDERTLVGDPDAVPRMADPTGGLYFMPFAAQASRQIQHEVSTPMPVDIADVLRFFVGQMMSTLQVKIALSTPVIKTEDWRLDLSKQKSRQLKHATILYPQKLLPCATGSSGTAESAH